jgi:hypothetical protein
LYLHPCLHQLALPQCVLLTHHPNSFLRPYPHGSVYPVDGGDSQLEQRPPDGSQHPDMASPVFCYDDDSWGKQWRSA